MSDETRIPGIRRWFTLPRSARSVTREIDDEIRFHIESRVAELVGRGMTRDTASAQALREYGDVTASRRELGRVERGRLARERWVARAETLRQDIAYAARSLRHNAAFSASVIAVLALGIGANATMFGVIDRLLLTPPLHVTDPAHVVTPDYMRTYNGATDHQDYFSYPQYLDLVQTAGAFTGVAGYTPTQLASGRGPDALSLRGMRVSASYFSTLGVRPQSGRFFLRDEDGAPVAPNVAVISYGFWQQHFGGTSAAIGAILPIGDLRYTVIGVAPRRFSGISSQAVDIWIPLTSGETPKAIAEWTHSRQGYWLQIVARLAPAITRERAAAMATRVMRADMLRDGVAAAQIAESQPSLGFTSVLPREAHGQDAYAKMALLLGAVSLLVLAMACANVANLQLTRGLRRRREMAVRSALGAGVGRLVQQLMTESILLATLGGVAALAVTWVGSTFVRRFVFSNIGWDDVPAVDVTLVVYAAAATFLCGILTGLVPALQARRARLTASLKEGAREGRTHESRTRFTLLVVQAALSVVMIIGAGLFVRSLQHVQALPIGMEPDRVLTAHININGVNYKQEEIDDFYRRLERVAVGYRGVESAAIAMSLPFYTSFGTRVSVPGRDSLPRVADGGPYFNAVTSGYLRTMGMHLLRGRDFTLADENPTHRVMIVNESFARLAWPNEDALGRCVKLGGDTMPCAEVIGVVANPRRQGIIEDVSLQLFLPLSQAPPWADTRNLLIRTRGDARQMVEPVRRYLQSSIPSMPYLNVGWMQDLVSPQTQSWRTGAIVFGVFGALAVLLAMVGLYSMLSYDVAQRAHELGVRVALGARPGNLARLVTGAGLRIVMIGALMGLGIAALAGRFVGPLLFETSPYQPAILVAAVALMLVVTIIATLLPTWRALRVDPIVALRSD